ncbi:MAG: hypothetical protein RBQ88_10595 [Desulfobulbus oligotrophicus]|nr:hypothetical protein [Desulfobulbus oligotrophicus]
MPLYTHDKLSELLQQAAKQPSEVYLFFGERYLCLRTANQLAEVLLQKHGGTIHPIDGDREDSTTTCARLRSFSLLPGRQIYRVTDTRLFLSKNIAKSIWERFCKAHADDKPDQAQRALKALLKSGGLDPVHHESDLASLSATEWKKCFGFLHPGKDVQYINDYLDTLTDENSAPVPDSSQSGEILATTLKAGIPDSNFLILIAEEVDKRMKLFKMLKDEQTVIDITAKADSRIKAEKTQLEILHHLLRQTLAEDNKIMAPSLTDVLLERVGFHPVALVMELRKVMAYTGDRREITRDDLDLLVGRTRQEALFELTNALSGKNLPLLLTIATRLQENNIHPLAIVATLRNHTRSLLLSKALAEQPAIGFLPSMNAQTFQHVCLSRLKEKEFFKKEFGSRHPYASYMQFKTAYNFSTHVLITWLQLLLKAEMKLKGSPVAADTILHSLLTSMHAAYTG